MSCARSTWVRTILFRQQRTCRCKQLHFAYPNWRDTCVSELAKMATSLVWDKMPTTRCGWMHLHSYGHSHFVGHRLWQKPSYRGFVATKAYHRRPGAGSAIRLTRRIWFEVSWLFMLHCLLRAGSHHLAWKTFSTFGKSSTSQKFHGLSCVKHFKRCWIW